MPPPAHSLELTATRGRIAIVLRAQRLGDDLSVTIGGGDRAHIGAVAVSQPRPSREPGGRTGATTSVIALPGHREDDLARRTAARLAAALGVVTCVAAGVHVDRIQPGEIRDVEELVEGLVTELLGRLASR